MKRVVFYLMLVALAVCACGRKGSAPLVGISCSRTHVGTDQLSPNYSQAVLKAGGVPVILPTISTSEQARELLSRVDGIIFSGGVDINPAWYGEEVWNETVEVDPVRDRSDSLLARAALESGKPVLAICRGEQLMNVMLGGSLYQDIPTQLPDAHVHRSIRHKMGIMEGSFLAQLFGTDSLEVNSFHHQAVKDLAPGLTLSACSDDGIVEAYENEQIWAVQFHPEGMLREDDTWLPLFVAFLDRIRL
jgi:putative glutamine amidotransferase